jgi:hypothetical protein
LRLKRDFSWFQFLLFSNKWVNLYRYAMHPSSAMAYGGRAAQVERSLTHSLKAPGFNPRAYKVKTRFQSLLSHSPCTSVTRRSDGMGGGVGSLRGPACRAGRLLRVQHRTYTHAPHAHTHHTPHTPRHCTTTEHTHSPHKQYTPTPTHHYTHDTTTHFDQNSMKVFSSI